MGKISKKLIDEHKKEEFSKIINLVEYKSIKDQINEIESSLASKLNDIDFDPNFKIYSLIQILLSYFSEEISIRDEFNEFYNEVIEIDSLYMPSYPPYSPITGSFDTLCTFCDLEIGKEKETIASIFYDIYQEMEVNSLFSTGLVNLMSSTMRFYKHLGIEKDLIKLKDIITDKEYLCSSTSNYQGKKGEIWLTRTVPNLDAIYDYHIILTTPYVIKNYTDKDWINFFGRHGIKKGELGKEFKYINFMKKNSKKKFWYDYIMDAYSDYQSNCIFLTGIPDIKGSKPHEL